MYILGYPKAAHSPRWYLESCSSSLYVHLNHSHNQAHWKSGISATGGLVSASRGDYRDSYSESLLIGAKLVQVAIGITVSKLQAMVCTDHRSGYLDRAFSYIRLEERSGLRCSPFSWPCDARARKISNRLSYIEPRRAFSFCACHASYLRVQA